MNTSLWGPPLWRILHTLSFSPDAMNHAVDVSEFIKTFRYILPCIFCRNSFRTFVTDLESKYEETLADTVSSGHLSRWLYKMHGLVNAKLDEQEHPGVKGRYINFECLTKRFILKPVAFTSSDVWEILQIFALNYPDAGADELTQKRRAYERFFQLIPDMLQIAGANQKLVELLADDEDVFLFDNATELFNYITRKKALFYGERNVLQFLSDEHSLFEICKATKCMQEICV